MRSVLGSRIHRDFLLQPERIGLVDQADVSRLAKEFSSIKQLPVSFFDAVMGDAEVAIDVQLFEDWKVHHNGQKDDDQQPKRGVIGAPVLAAPPKKK